MHSFAHIPQELEELTNKCARSCNKLRAELATDARSNIDSILTDLCPIFDLKVGPL